MEVFLIILIPILFLWFLFWSVKAGGMVLDSAFSWKRKAMKGPCTLCDSKDHNRLWHSPRAKEEGLR